MCSSSKIGFGGILVLLLACRAYVPPQPTLEAKIRGALTLWEFSRAEYLDLTKLNESETSELRNALSGEPDATRRDAISLLLALNCAHPDIDRRFRFLNEYRCSRADDFVLFADSAVRDFDSILALAFSRAEHRDQAIAFLEHHLRFWQAEPSVLLGTDDREYLLELIGFLKAGGYPPSSKAPHSPFHCSRLATIRDLPFREDEESQDETYLYVMSIEKRTREAGLVSCIDDTTPMEDPREAPVYGGFVVGDVAVMLLSDSTGVPIEDLLPDEVKAEWTEQGIYSYFGYVASESNRNKLKEQWGHRLGVLLQQ